MTFFHILSCRLSLLRNLLLLTIFIGLAGCSPETAATPAAVEDNPAPTTNPAMPVTRAEATAIPPTRQADEPNAPTAEPVSTSETKVTPEPASTDSPAPEGALIRVSMKSQAGVLLDGIPDGVRDQIAGDLLGREDAFWLAKAQEQIRLTRNRLNFRNFVYPGKGQLPLPPEEVWSIELDPIGPTRQTIQGHDLVMIAYTFNSTLLTDAESPGQSEPVLAEVGGAWQEPFVFPADPDLLLQRTDNACINEGGFPANSFDSENVWVFYDYTCEADSDGAAGCHRTQLPRLSCREALEERVGEVEAFLRFERTAWNRELADAVRVETVATTQAPDLKVVGEDLETNRISYQRRFVKSGRGCIRSSLLSCPLLSFSMRLGRETRDGRSEGLRSLVCNSNSAKGY